ncbi:MAG: potassium/proton antiporter [Chitinispirillaceae bacterium]|nr:potassium/proton antiporter [Chitinispirillaceae bacterium]
MYIIAALILISIVLTAHVANKWRLPLVVIALGTGIVFSSDVTGFIYFENPAEIKLIADFALVFILFIGGFGTKREMLKTVLGPSTTLSTLGVVITATAVCLLLYLLLDCNFTHALLLGCIISSTDAAAVFSILRSRALSPRMSAIIEIESASNDPMAIILTASAVQFISVHMQHPLGISASLLWQLAAGVGIGLLTGKAGCLLFQRVKMLDRGYFYIFLIGIILLSYGAADAVSGSGMIAVFFAGYIMGNADLPYKKTLATFLDALSTIANVGLFVMLGLIVFPREFGAIWMEGLLLFLVLTFIARPLAVFACTYITGFSVKDKLFMSWSGLRGAVPIVLATYPVAAGIDDSHAVFNTVFFAVALSMLIQGTTIGTIAERLKLTVKAKPKPNQVMELVTVHTSDLELCEIRIDDDQYEGLVRISSLALPKATTITMINRNDEIIAPQGATEILPGDVLYVLVKNTNAEAVTSEIVGRFTLKKNAAA